VEISSARRPRDRAALARDGRMGVGPAKAPSFLGGIAVAERNPHDLS
jgi:hypothetical protein